MTYPPKFGNHSRRSIVCDSDHCSSSLWLSRHYSCSRHLPPLCLWWRKGCYLEPDTLIVVGGPKGTVSQSHMSRSNDSTIHASRVGGDARAIRWHTSPFPLDCQHRKGKPGVSRGRKAMGPTGGLPGCRKGGRRERATHLPAGMWVALASPGISPEWIWR